MADTRNHAANPSVLKLNKFISPSNIRDNKRKPRPPGPPALPIIGHLHLLKQPIHRSIHKLSHTYGPIMSLRFVEECLVKKNDIVFANRPLTLAGKYLSYDYKSMAFAPYGDHWRGLRRITNQELSSTSRLALSSPAREDEVLILLKQLFDKCRGGGWAQVEPRHRFVDLIFDVMVRMISGKRYCGTDVASKEAMEFKNSMDEIFELLDLSMLDLFPILQWLDPFGVVKRMKKAMMVEDNFLQSLLDENRRKGNDERKYMTLVEAMLSQKHTDPVFFSDDNIKAISGAIIAAGTETSASTMEWALANLLKHPEVMKKLKAEIESEVGTERFLDESDIGKLPYLQNVVLETLRLYPAGGLGLPRMNSEDCTVGGYHIPKGTMLMVNVWAMQRDPKLWRDASRFMPERMESGQTGYGFIPFGAGRRICPGANIAKRLMALTMGLLVQAFEWKKIGDGEIDMMEGGGLTLPKVEPLVALIRPRPEMITLLSQLSSNTDH
ncbi:isoflavone 2'-hydroxylase-like [Senna tora]|uniref:Isoflavone 2'-hydroxylase-like n=1 Tax=Senna tora TaxID=362788 RepID=A0A834TYW8_9FABA|nr:isoflavone 2'-hydroxylase-like [Senna tora]